MLFRVHRRRIWMSLLPSGAVRLIIWGRPTNPILMLIKLLREYPVTTKSRAVPSLPLSIWHPLNRSIMKMILVITTGMSSYTVILYRVRTGPSPWTCIQLYSNQTTIKTWGHTAQLITSSPTMKKSLPKFKCSQKLSARPLAYRRAHRSSQGTN